jgi:hypothetical protein
MAFSPKYVLIGRIIRRPFRKPRMRLEKLSIQNFRTIEGLTFEFPCYYTAIRGSPQEREIYVR